jgi:hypothetical protein
MTGKSTNPKGWELFESCFSEGEEVIAIDDLDRFWWGMLTDVTDFDCVLVRPGRNKRLSWDDIRFMSHDGFPIKEVLGADGSSTIESIDTTDTQAAIRAALDDCSRVRSRARFGDPFDITEPVRSRLFHTGNSGSRYWRSFYNENLQRYLSPIHRVLGYEAEEVIVMESNDGARAELWDLTSVYCFESRRDR